MGSWGSSQGQRFRSESPDPNHYSMGIAGQSLLRPHLIQSPLHRTLGPSASCSRISQSLNMVPRFFPVESFMQSWITPGGYSRVQCVSQALYHTWAHFTKIRHSSYNHFCGGLIGGQIFVLTALKKNKSLYLYHEVVTLSFPDFHWRSKPTVFLLWKLWVRAGGIPHVPILWPYWI